MSKRPVELKNLIVQLYEVFAPYDSIDDLDSCSACYTSEQTEILKSVPASKIGTKLARKLLWEAKDHWKSPSVYKHFLPRILEVMSPPESEEDLFPVHLIEVLEQLNFSSWPNEEKMIVSKFLRCLAPLVYQDKEDYIEFNEGLSSLIAIKH